MNTPTYKEQFDKLTRAYINGEVDAYDECACFVGNLLNKSNKWANGGFISCRRASSIDECVLMEANGYYTANEINKLETSFMDMLPLPYMITEDILFHAFEKTLELLKQIHISKGENVEGEFEFKKRELVSVN